MSDMPNDRRGQLLDIFLRLVAERGYGEVSLGDVGAASGLGMADLYRLYPDKLAFVQAFMARIDGEVLAGTSASLDPEETVRDRLFDILMRRFDALKPHRAALDHDPPGRTARSDDGLGPGTVPDALDGGDAGGGRHFRPWITRRGPAKCPSGDLCGGLPGLRRGRVGRPLQDHGRPRQPAEDGGALGSNL